MPFLGLNPGDITPKTSLKQKLRESIHRRGAWGLSPKIQEFRPKSHPVGVLWRILCGSATWLECPGSTWEDRWVTLNRNLIKKGLGGPTPCTCTSTSKVKSSRTKRHLRCPAVPCGHWPSSSIYALSAPPPRRGESTRTR